MEEKLASLFLHIKGDSKAAMIDVTDTYFTGDSLGSEPRKGKKGGIKKLTQISLIANERIPVVPLRTPWQYIQQVYHGRHC